MWKARQLKEYKRANHLCFKCGEKSTPNHTYSTAVSQLNVMQNVVVDGGDILSDEMMEALKTPQLCMMNDDYYLSLHALSGQPQHKAIQLRAMVQNLVLIILIDSSSSHTFLNSSIAEKL
jgi:hypothetical protein